MGSDRAWGPREPLIVSYAEDNDTKLAAVSIYCKKFYITSDVFYYIYY